MIATTSLAALLVRTMLSLVVVLAVVAVAYLIARRRTRGVGRVATPAEPGRRSLSRRRRTAPPGIEVVGRVGLTRSTAAVAVRFGERVVLIAANEQGASNVISEMPATAWDDLRTVRAPIATSACTKAPAKTAAPPTSTSVVLPRPSFLEALRQATARHA